LIIRPWLLAYRIEWNVEKMREAPFFGYYNFNELVSAKGL
jgi:hypothetical protein